MEAPSKKRARVALGLSGGVDSAVSAALLCEQEYDVTGVFLVCYRGPGCRTDEDRKDALDVALKLGIPFEVLDLRKEYQEKVLEYFKTEYQAGRTPNPDVVCNREIKFGLFYEWALRQAQGKQKYDYIATGHYARIWRIRERSKSKSQKPSKIQDSRFKNRIKYQLQIPKDTHKDQTYFLYQLKEEQLAHILFPLGEMTKQQVREEAKKRKFKVAEKPDSQGICFVGEVSVPEFLKQMGVKEKPGMVFLKVPNSKSQKPSKVQASNSNYQELVEIGEHRGVWFYTVGQRIVRLQVTSHKQQAEYDRNFRKAGFELARMPPLYVVGKDVVKNRLIVGTREECLRNEFEVGSIHWINQGDSEQWTVNSNIQVRIRHGGELIRVVRVEQVGQVDHAESSKIPNTKYKILLAKPVFGVAPGQAAVFYLPAEAESDSAEEGEGEVCLGGGIIQ